MTQESEELEKTKQPDPPQVVEEELQGKHPAESKREASSPVEDDIGEEDFVDPFEDDRPGYRSQGSRKRIGIFCFSCNRREGQYLSQSKPMVLRVPDRSD
ncbi:unnamed protein product, partial [marine sediment metagenome]